MADRTDGGAAFPQHLAIGPSCDVYGSAYYDEGMSLRDWFAGQALSAILSSNAENGPIAATCYAVADAMLAARKEGA